MRDILFLDNNIPIGFCFRQDPQHDFVVKIFNHNCEIKWSNNVLYEFKKVYKRKRNAFDDWIYNLIIELNNTKNVMTELQLVDIASKLRIKGFNQIVCFKLIKLLWKESSLNSSEHSKNILESIKNFKLSFNKGLSKSYSICIKKLNPPFERKNHYPLIAKQLKNKIDGYDDLTKLGSDMNICLDAHEMGKQINSLKFLTDDEKIINHKIDIQSITKIKKVISLKEYVLLANL